MTIAVLHASGLNAVVHRIDGYRNILSAEQCLHGDKHLLCQPLLYLWTLREKPDETIDLAETNNGVFGNISHFCRAIYCDEVMLACAGEIDVVDADHLFDLHLVFNHRDFRKMRIVEPAENFIHVHLRNAMRCLL